MSNPEVQPNVGPVLDARNRAWRTLITNLLTDLLVVIVLFLLPVFTSDSFSWSATDWKVLWLSLAKTVVVTVLSYLARVLHVGPGTITR